MGPILAIRNGRTWGSERFLFVERGPLSFSFSAPRILEATEYIPTTDVVMVITMQIPAPANSAAPSRSAIQLHLLSVPSPRRLHKSKCIIGILCEVSFIELFKSLDDWVLGQSKTNSLE